MLRIGDVKIDGRVILSPMAGISDSPYRLLTRKMGSAFSFTEFVSADGITHFNQKTIRLFQYKEEERPVCFQIFGNDIKTIVDAAKISEELKPDIIDINMGCSTSKVSQRGSGAGLLKKPAYAGKIIETLRKNLRVPVTAKIRIGWDHDSLNYKEVVTALQDSGVQAISVHGRTKQMGYKGHADWKVIGEIKSFASVPIFGNGDVLSYEEAMQKLHSSGVDGILIGRAGIGNPWLFSGKDKSSIDLAEMLHMIRSHLRYMLDFYGELGLVLFRKHLAKYLKEYPKLQDCKRQLLTCNSVEQFDDLLETISPEYFVFSS
ncbi:MAG: tRNA dihydrouridine synthase DusB [Spirochaetota bacterium]